MNKTAKHIKFNSLINNKIVRIVLCILLAIVLCIPVTACAKKDKTGVKSKFNNDPNTLSVCMASEPQSIDPALNSTADGATLILHLFSGIAHTVKTSDGEFVIEPDCVVSLPDPVENADGTFTYTYTVRNDAYWSDGEPVTSHDFIFSWNRAASVEVASDFTYLFDTIVGYEDMWSKNPPEDAHLDMVALDDKTFSVTVTAVLPYWNELLCLPTFMPVRSDVVDNEGMWATKAETYVSNGCYTMTDWVHNSVISLTKNVHYHDSKSVTMPNLKFYLSDNTNNQLTNFKNGDWQYIKSPPTNEISALKRDYEGEFHADPMVGMYYTTWQMNFDLSPVGGRQLTHDEQCEVRMAINLLLDRNYIVENVTQGGQTPANTFVPTGVKDWDGVTDFHDNAGKSTEYHGYFPTSKESIQQNYADALEILHKYYEFDSNDNVTNFPTITYIYNTNEAHKAIAEYYQNVLDGIGIKMNLENQEWATFLSTKKAGDFTICRAGWTGDYNDPICFLDLFMSTAGNNASQFGKGDNANKAVYDMDLSDIPGYEDKSVFKGTWANTYDDLIGYIKHERDAETRSKLMHRAEDMLMETGAVCPIYNYTSTYMLKNYVKGYFVNTLDQSFFMYTTIE